MRATNAGKKARTNHPYRGFIYFREERRELRRYCVTATNNIGVNRLGALDSWPHIPEANMWVDEQHLQFAIKDRGDNLHFRQGLA